MAFDGENILGELGQNGRRIPRSRADFQDAIRWFELGSFRHSCDDEWLGDRLGAPDRQRAIFIGEFFKARIYERLARHLTQSRKDAFVFHPPAGNVRIDHAMSGMLVVRHGQPSARGLRCSLSWCSPRMIWRSSLSVSSTSWLSRVE